MNFQVNAQATNQITKYVGTVYHALGLRAQDLRDRVDWMTLVRYGRFRLSDNGDKVRVADLIARDPTARDNSFVRVSTLNNYYCPLTTSNHAKNGPYDVAHPHHLMVRFRYESTLCPRLVQMIQAFGIDVPETQDVLT
jgi:hypothetical protein